MEDNLVPLEAVAVSLAAMLDMAAATPLHETLIEARGRNLVLDAADVRHLGAQCAQLLTSAASTWRADGHQFSIKPRSAAFEDGTRLLGLESILQDEI